METPATEYEITINKTHVLTRALDVVKSSRPNDAGDVSADKVVEVYKKLWAAISE